MSALAPTPSEVRQQCGTAAYVVYQYLFNRISGNLRKGLSYCFQAAGRIGSFLGYKANTIYKAIGKLKRAGFIIVTHPKAKDGDQTNHYSIPCIGTRLQREDDLKRRGDKSSSNYKKSDSPNLGAPKPANFSAPYLQSAVSRLKTAGVNIGPKRQETLQGYLSTLQERDAVYAPKLILKAGTAAARVIATGDEFQAFDCFLNKFRDELHIERIRNKGAGSSNTSAVSDPLTPEQASEIMKRVLA